MKKFFVTLSAIAMMAPAFAQEAEETVSFHQVLKTYFIDGGPGFMAMVALALVLGVAFVVERIIYLNLAEVNTKKLVASVEEALEANNVEEALEICKKTRGPIASIFTQALIRLKDGQSLEDIDKAITSYGALQSGYLEKNLSWITLFIAAAPSLGFLGTAVGMVQAFDDIVKAGDISPTVVASGMKVALITTIGGIIVALILQIFYNYLLSKVEAIVSDMEDASISLLDAIIKFSIKK
ncbi:MAG: MotA/TolQ/ExbB proton channel family protein [Bacteroidales bacterium]|nr:MotA/TolQ/ExbB proton channel family protein [Bacteroidales bacterium]MBP5681440.1 MotA/TolQ/ExbB proton channel family protein [Bacteroidales bacterium]